MFVCANFKALFWPFMTMPPPLSLQDANTEAESWRIINGVTKGTIRVAKAGTERH